MILKRIKNRGRINNSIWAGTICYIGAGVQKVRFEAEQGSKRIRGRIYVCEERCKIKGIQVGGEDNEMQGWNIQYEQ